MKLLLALAFSLVAPLGLARAEMPLQQGRSVALCSDRAPVCAYMRDGSAAEVNDCEARRGDAVRIVPGTCWDAD